MTAMLTATSASAESYVPDSTGCLVWYDGSEPLPVTVTWTGGCTEGKASGTGTMSFIKSGILIERYEGQVLSGKPHGQGTSTDKAGVYKGGYLNGKPNGKATVTVFGMLRFEGEFLDNGNGTNGVTTFDKGGSYSGESRKYKFHGTGVRIYPDGTKEEGQFFEGNFKKGVRKFANGNRYEGEFVNDQLEGEGSLITQSGIQRRGHFEKGLLNGKGVEVTPAGSRYDGNWVNGDATGYGVLYKDGVTFEGHFEDGQYVGKLNWPKIRVAAQSGDVNAQTDLCNGYVVGWELSGLTKNHDESLRWCLAAAKQGRPYAQFMTGLHLSSGYGDKQFSSSKERHQAAIAWYREAEKNRYPSAGKAANEHEEWFNKEYGGSSDWLGKIIVGAAVTGLVGSSSIGSADKVKIIGAVASDLAGSGEGKATGALLSQTAAAAPKVERSGASLTNLNGTNAGSSAQKNAAGSDQAAVAQTTSVATPTANTSKQTEPVNDPNPYQFDTNWRQVGEAAEPTREASCRTATAFSQREIASNAAGLNTLVTLSSTACVCAYSTASGYYPQWRCMIYAQQKNVRKKGPSDGVSK